MDDVASLRPKPDIAMVLGALFALAGYLMPWFKLGDDYEWWFSGWSYAGLSSGGGWTLFTFVWLAVALGAALWAGGSAAAAMTGLVATAGTLVMSSAVVAVSFAMVPEKDALNPVANLPFGLGLPVLGIGLGLLLAGGCRATALAVLRAPAADSRPAGV
ncbi:hypothetical protein [Cryptosporangium aurantiacum]|uniref:hypothetical protein n=1 Tax=Cryptosporangium aurantiacum TaxID=134849 RepID=UPI000A013CA6|nr:hypothetical protein [Cryptosporangium aurantiacum]